jgi:hypothetical protein
MTDQAAPSPADLFADIQPQGAPAAPRRPRRSAQRLREDGALRQEQRDVTFGPLQRTLRAATRRALEGAQRRRGGRVSPSMIADPCDRKIGFQAAQAVPEPRADNPGIGVMSREMGTAFHAHLADRLPAQLLRDQLGELTAPGRRVLAERSVAYRGMRGTVDYLIAWDAAAGGSEGRRTVGAVVDLKTVSQSKFKQLRDEPQMMDEWRVQTSVYAAGAVASGLVDDVVAVVILVVPRDGAAGDIITFAEAFDQGVADAALDRRDRIVQTVRESGPLALAPTLSFRCQFCPFYRPDVPEGDASCAGFGIGGKL